MVVVVLLAAAEAFVEAVVIAVRLVPWCWTVNTEIAMTPQPAITARIGTARDGSPTAITIPATADASDAQNVGSCSALRFSFTIGVWVVVTVDVYCLGNLSTLVII